MMSRFNDVTAADLWLAPIPWLSGCAGGYIDRSRVNACTVTLAVTLGWSATVSWEISNFQSKFTETSQENCKMLSFAFTLASSDALLMVIKWYFYWCASLFSQCTIVPRQHGSELI